jgi:hypothetical protein
MAGMHFIPAKLVRIAGRMALASAALLAAPADRAAAAPPRYGFVKIAEQTTPPPNGTSFFELMNQAPPAISHGTVAFASNYNTSHSFKSGIFTGDGGPLTQIATAGLGAVAGFDLDDGAASYHDHRGVYAVNEEGELTVIAEREDLQPDVSHWMLSFNARRGHTTLFIGDTFQGQSGLYSHRDDDFTPIVQRGDMTPLGAVVGVNAGAIDAQGVIAFLGAIEGQGYGQFIYDHGAVSRVATTLDEAIPGSPFHMFGYSAIDDGQVVFKAEYYGGGRTGIFRGDGVGPVAPVALWGDPAPEGQFYEFDNPAVAAGAAAFLAEFGANVITNPQHGIFVAAGGAPAPVIKTGDPLFGSTVKELRFGRFGLDDDGSGRIAFLYRLADGSKGFAMGIDLAADFDEDEDVDGNDLANWKASFGLNGAATHLQGDADGDLDVDGGDFLVWQRQLGSMATMPASLTVPEPASATLLGLALLIAVKCSPLRPREDS